MRIYVNEAIILVFFDKPQYWINDTMVMGLMIIINEFLPYDGHDDKSVSRLHSEMVNVLT